MKTDKFVKGLLLMLSVIVVGMSKIPVVWAAVITTAICTGIPYYVKNYLMPSTSAQGQLNWKDALSAVILAVCASVSNSIADLVINGAIDFVALKNIVIGVLGTYLSTTYFTGQLAEKK